MAADIRTAFGRRVRDLRMARHLSQEALAERSALHRNYVGGIERGERNVALVNIAKLAKGLDVSVAELFAPFSGRLSHR